MVIMVTTIETQWIILGGAGKGGATGQGVAGNGAEESERETMLETFDITYNL